MKNIILQHWTGEMDELGILSSANIEKYAKKCGAEYKLLRGNVFRPNLQPPCQKLHMLEEAFDEYDTVVMVDIDVFTRAGMEENIFDESIQGIGMSTEFQAKLLTSMRRRLPGLTNPNHTYWGGAIYKLGKELRRELRSHIDEKEMINNSYLDEGIMHRLATLANIKKQQLPGGRKWSHGSYEDGIEKAALIHIRTKIAPQGPKRPKLVNYKDIIKRGLIYT